MARNSKRKKQEPAVQPGKEQLDLARAQGEAFQRAVDYMIHQVAHGEEKKAGEYLVAYAVEKPEGIYHLLGDRLVWHDPEYMNTHIEIVVRDAADGRFIPCLTVYLAVIDPAGHEIGNHMLPFIWHPWLYHYGLNWKLPASGDYKLAVRILPPGWSRHDRVNGLRYEEEVQVEFTGVYIDVS